MILCFGIERHGQIVQQLSLNKGAHCHNIDTGLNFLLNPSMKEKKH